MMPPPVVSVVIPVFNVASCLERCLDSVIRQTLQDIEIIVVDDGSTDQSPAIIARYAALDSRIRVITQTNQGLSVARNRGIEIASGEFLAFVDSDDTIDDDMLEAMTAQAYDDEADIVVCGVKRLTPEGLLYQKTQMVPPFDMDQILSGNINRAAWNKIYRRALFTANKLLYPPGLLHEDLCITCQLFFFARKISWTSRHFYAWYCYQHSISQTIGVRHIHDIFTNFKNLAIFLEQQQAMDQFEASFVRGCFNYVVGLVERIRKCYPLERYAEENETRQQLFSHLMQELDEFEYTNLTRREWLKSFDYRIYLLSVVKGNMMSENLYEKSKEDLILELQQARLALLTRQLGANEYQFQVNLEFSMHINRLIGWVKEYKKEYARIAIYGYSLIGQIVAKELGNQLVVIADRAVEMVDSTTYELCHVEQLPNYQFDCILVCVLGREPTIRKYLTEVINIPPENIICFDLTEKTPKPRKAGPPLKCVGNEPARIK